MFSRNSKEVVKSKGTRGEKLDFDEEARKLFKSININPGEIGGEYNYLDPIWRHPTSGGVLYVGNQTAAQDLQIQATHKITHVVNCTADMPNYHEGKTGAMPKYYRFDVSNHWRYLNSRENSVQDFVAPLFRFIEEALTNGNGVLVHCLAGAHRAGTTGVACLMHLTGQSADSATVLAKRCRPVINPIGMLPQFLERLQGFLEARPRRGFGTFA
mmetsp:Transcript_18024/g.30314  ORF Transcript_18024/g.30314 Transcript_18024/m.30314 type:complete len:214 (+) Transcript_18024:345-986(+)